MSRKKRRKRSVVTFVEVQPEENVVEIPNSAGVTLTLPSMPFLGTLSEVSVGVTVNGANYSLMNVNGDPATFEGRPCRLELRGDEWQVIVDD